MVVQPYNIYGCSVHYRDLWANFITFMVSGFITFVVKSYYIYGQFLLHLWVIQLRSVKTPGKQ